MNFKEKFKYFEDISKRYPDEFELYPGKGVSELLIGEAELELGLRFPLSYKCFLREYGCAVLVGQEILGLIGYKSQTPGIRTVISATELCRRHKLVEPPFIVIVDNDGTEFFYLESSSETVEDMPVFRLVRGANESVQPYACSFVEFIQKRLDFFDLK